MKQRFFITIEKGEYKYELFEIDFNSQQIVIKSSLPCTKELHFTQHQPDIYNKNIGWHIKKGKSLILLENRCDFIDVEIRDIGFVLFGDNLVEKCKKFSRKGFDDVIYLKNEKSYKRLAFYFFRSKKQGLSDNLDLILRRSGVCGEAYYFESKSDITVGVIVLNYNSNDLFFLDLAGIVTNIAPIIKYIRVSQNGEVKNDCAVNPKSFPIRTVGGNFIQCGGVVLDF